MVLTKQINHRECEKAGEEAGGASQHAYRREGRFCLKRGSCSEEGWAGALVEMGLLRLVVPVMFSFTG